MPIHVLSDDLAAKIAAGEVIERPASVVKELIENSIDAGAREIKVEIRNGGQRLIRVADDGVGIPASEVETAFARHATSKLSSVDDLFNIHTLGFRGEALPSIASVARVTLITRARVEESGTQIKVDGGEIVEQRAQGAPAGTVVTVEELFRHVPARLKFMKSAGTETGHVADLISAYALAFPGLRFSLTSDDRLAFQSPGTGELRDVLVKVFGVETAAQMLQVSSLKLQHGDENVIASEAKQSPRPSLETLAQNASPEVSAKSAGVASSQPFDSASLHSESPLATTSSIRVSGYVSPPNVNRATRKHLLFFVNHRWIQDRALAHAVIEAYHTALMVGRFPVVVLDITLPTDAVDVNAHPTKSQVRFRDSSAVFNAVQRPVRAAISSHAPIPSIGVGVPWRNYSTQPYSSSPDQSQLALNPHRPISNLSTLAPHASAGVSQSLSPTTQPPNHPTTQFPMLRVLGQIASTYIIAEGPEGLYLIDQHAAHERVLYEQLSAERAAARIAIQELLDPASMSLSPTQFATLQANRDAFASFGFHAEPFGGDTALLRAVPAVMNKADPRAALVGILDEMEQGEEPLEKSADARLITSICKSIAVKGGQVLSLEEMRELVRRLEQTASPRTCPHGRPTAIQLNLGQLEREFGRK